MTWLTFLVLGFAAGSVINPKTGAKYTLVEELNVGRRNVLSKVITPEGLEAAMKVDKEFLPLTTPNMEAHILALMWESPRVPKLYDTFIIPDESDPRKGKRCLVLELAGLTIKQFMRNGRKRGLPEPTAGSIGLQVIEGISELHSLGYYHMNLNYDNVAFKGEWNQIILLDLTDAKVIPSQEISEELANTFSVESVFHQFISSESAEVDFQSFDWTIRQTDDDIFVTKFLEQHSWSPEAIVAIRNCRILAHIDSYRRHTLRLADTVEDLFHMIVSKIDTSLELDWFSHIMLRGGKLRYVEKFINKHTELTDIQIALIRGTFALGNRILADDAALKEFTSCAKTILQALGIGPVSDSAFNWFLEGLTNGPKDAIGSSILLPEPRALVELVWEVSHGIRPVDYSEMADVLHRFISNQNRIYSRSIIW